MKDEKKDFFKDSKMSQGVSVANCFIVPAYMPFHILLIFNIGVQELNEGTK